MDAAFDRENLESIERADVVLLGRESFDGFSSYWPFVADAPAPADPNAREARAVDRVNRAISRRYNELPKVVVSDRGPVPADNAWHASTTVVSRSGVAEWLATNTREGSGDVLVFGSHVLWNALPAAGLVDELHLMVSPLALATGVPLFTGPATLETLATRTYDDSPNVQLRYAVQRPTN
jgi:dihydrofolate reductase